MLESLVGLLATVDGRRIGRAVDGIAQGYYRVQVVKVDEEHGLVTAYVLAFNDGQFTAEYCVDTRDGWLRLVQLPGLHRWRPQV
ncbi:MAG: hypothetical protein PWQ39_1572 [Thermacetogenium sp.]|jgi:hypothetical protein|nr:hypothetical protein [Thermacetogenium sp.]